MTTTILSGNAGYLLGYRNVLGGYVPPPVAAVLGDAAVERRALGRLVALLDRERPDVVSLQEVDRGSHRTRTDGQLGTLLERLRARDLHYDGAAWNKYGAGRLTGALPFYGHLGNAVLSRSGGSRATGRASRPTRAHYLTAGRKRLVLETEIAADVVGFLVHLSLGARSRSRQLRELAGLVTDRADDRDVVVAGDFNALDGPSELSAFADRTGLTVRAPGETVPERPLDDLLDVSRSLDLFCCSPRLAVRRCEVLDVQLSDHRPVVLELAD